MFKLTVVLDDSPPVEIVPGDPGLVEMSSRSATALRKVLDFAGRAGAFVLHKPDGGYRAVLQSHALGDLIEPLINSTFQEFDDPQP